MIILFVGPLKVSEPLNSIVDNENALAIKNLIDNGFLHSILLSQDVFIKMMLKKYGGFGYTYILTHFKKILLSVGVTNEQINEILINNPRKVFSFDTG